MRRRVGSRKYHQQWFGGQVQFGSITTAGAKLTMIAASALHQYGVDPTIIRIVGNLRVGFARTSFTATESVLVAAGIRCCDESLAVSNPGVQADKEYSWTYGFSRSAYTQTLQYWNGSAGTNYSSNALNEMPDVLVDIRAMRKVPADCELRFEALKTNLTGSPGDAEIVGYLRTLVRYSRSR